MAAAEGHLDHLRPEYREIADARCRHIPRALKVRLVLLLFLSPSLLATITSAVAQALPIPDDFLSVIDWILSIASATTIVLTVAFLIVSRYVDQLEKDLLACLALSPTTGRPPSGE